VRCTSLCISFCLRRPFHISHLWGFLMFWMLLLKAAVYVGSELQASIYSLKTNTERCGRFIYLFLLFLRISFWEWRSFAFWLEQCCSVMWADIKFLVDKGNLGVVSAQISHAMGTWKCLSRTFYCVLSLAAFHHFGFVKIRDSQGGKINRGFILKMSVCAHQIKCSLK